MAFSAMLAAPISAIPHFQHIPMNATYYAFISYSHRDDAFAKRLHHYLEHYRMPARLCRLYPDTPKALRPIFRDDSDLAIGQLNETLREAIASSRYLIVICSANSVRPNADGKNWIDEEVRMFLALHGGDAERVLPIILRQEDEDATACLLPVIQQHGILATDSCSKGEERAMNDLIAKMAGLLPDVLWDRHLREQKKQRTLRRLCAGTAAALAAAAGWYCWDYYVPHTHCYADYIERDNLPVGLHPLSREQLPTQHRYYRFTTHKHRLRTVEHCNSAGSLQEHEFPWQQERPASLSIEYAEDGTVAHSIHRNACGKELITRKFAPGTIDFVHTVEVDGVRSEATRTAPLTTDYLAGDGATPRSSIGRFLVQRGHGEQHGLITRELFCRTHSLTPMKDAQGLGGREYSLDPLGRPTEVRYLAVLSPSAANAQTTAKETKDAHAGYRLRYGVHGRVECITWFNKEEYIIDSGGKDSELRLSYDPQGRATEIAYLDANGNPGKTASGVSRTTRRYDERGNMVEERFWGKEGEPCLNNKGYARCLMSYDPRGYMVAATYYGLDGKPCYTQYGFATCRWQYDARGNKTDIATFAPDGSPSYSALGFTRVSLRYNERGDTTEVAFFGADGAPCLARDGYARATMSYDDEGNKIAEIWYGVDGQPCQTTQGYARTEWQHDERGNIVEEIHYGVDGKLCLNPRGYARATMRYDAQGNRCEEAYFGVDELPTLCEGTHARLLLSYDANGKLAEESYLDAEGKPCLNARGYARVQHRYDALGVLFEDSFYGTDGRLCLNADGYAVAWYSFDERGNIVSLTLFDTERNRCNGKAGYAHRLRRYDAHGNIIEELWDGADGKPINNPQGYTRMVAEYDERGNQVLMSCYDAEDELTLCHEGYASVLREFDARGNVTEECFYDTEGEPCLTRGGYTRRCYTYNELGKLTSTTDYDLAGNTITP